VLSAAAAVASRLDPGAAVAVVSAIVQLQTHASNPRVTAQGDLWSAAGFADKAR